MTTDANQTSVKDFQKIAYEVVGSIPTLEKNDNIRLGYHVYELLIGKIESVEEAVKVSNPRSSMAKDDMVKIIKENLKNSGIDII
jgi:hypothetical protein